MRRLLLVRLRCRCRGCRVAVVAGWSGVVESGATAGVLAFFGVGFGLAGVLAEPWRWLESVRVGCFFASAPVYSAPYSSGQFQFRPLAASQSQPPLPGFCSIPVLTGLLTFGWRGRSFCRWHAGLRTARSLRRIWIHLGHAGQPLRQECPRRAWARALRQRNVNCLPSR